VVVERQRPRRDRDRVYFIVQDGPVQLTNLKSRSIAARMTRARWSDTRGGFNRKLVYEPLGWL
jgi:hypothetical protein